MKCSCETPASRGTWRCCPAMVAHARPLPSLGTLNSLTRSPKSDRPGNTTWREKGREAAELARRSGSPCIAIGEQRWGGLTRGGSNRPAVLFSLFSEPGVGGSFPPTFFPTCTSKHGVKGHKDGAGRSSFTSLALLWASALRSCQTLCLWCSRSEGAVGWTMLLLPPPPPRLENGPFPFSRLGLCGLPTACSGTPASPAKPSGTGRSPPRVPSRRLAQLQHWGAAPATPENQDAHSGLLQPHQLDSDSHLRLPYLGLFRQRVQHHRILRGSEAGLYFPGVDLYASCIQLLHANNV